MRTTCGLCNHVVDEDDTSSGEIDRELAVATCGQCSTVFQLSAELRKELRAELPGLESLPKAERSPHFFRGVRPPV